MTEAPALGPTALGARGRILALLDSGALRPGQRLGGERELARDLGVARSTLRQALGALERDGVVRRVPGRGGGTFAAGRMVERDLTTIVGVPELLRSQGFTAGTRVISAAVAAADPPAAAALGLETGALLVDLVRIRLADAVPISLDHAWFPAARFPGLLELPLGGSVYELLAAHYGARPAEAVEHIEVVAADAAQAALLAIEPGAALLSVTRTTCDGDGRPFEYAHDLFRADRTRIVVRTPGAGTTTDVVHSADRAIVELRAAA